MTKELNLSKTFSEIIPPELIKGTHIEARLERVRQGLSFGSADGTFADVLTAYDRPVDKMDFEGLLFAYSRLLNDTKTPHAVIHEVLPYLTEALVRSLNETPLAQQDRGNLAVFSSDYSSTRSSGRFDAEETGEISRVVKAMCDNFCLGIK